MDFFFSTDFVPPDLELMPVWCTRATADPELLTKV